MKLIYADYFEKFKCIADKCTDTCCAGWEIDIDPKSYEAYMKIPGEFGDRLRASIKTYDQGLDDDSEGAYIYEAHGFVLTKDKRCSFLKDNGLCDLYINLGEKALCDVCTDTPRNFLDYGKAREISLSLSCPEAARLMLSKKDSIKILSSKNDESFDLEESDEDLEFAYFIRDSRDKSIEILQNKNQEISKRIIDFLDFSKTCQEKINNNDISPKEDFPFSTYDLFKKRLDSFSQLDSISEEWENYILDFSRYFVDKNTYKKAIYSIFKLFKEEDRLIELENILVYQAFLLLGRSIDDYDFLGKAKLAALSYLMILDMCSLHFFKNKKFSNNDIQDICRIFAKEIEHSQENIDFLFDEILFEDEYSIASLKKALNI